MQLNQLVELEQAVAAAHAAPAPWLDEANQSDVS